MIFTAKNKNPESFLCKAAPPSLFPCLLLVARARLGPHQLFRREHAEKVECADDGHASVFLTVHLGCAGPQSGSASGPRRPWARATTPTSFATLPGPGSWLADMLGRLAVRYPELPIAFAGSRRFAECLPLLRRRGRRRRGHGRGRRERPTCPLRLSPGWPRGFWNPAPSSLRAARASAIPGGSRQERRQTAVAAINQDNEWMTEGPHASRESTHRL